MRFNLKSITMENSKSFEVKELTQFEQLEVEGGFWIGPPPQWVIDLAVEIDKAVDAYMKGLKAGSELI
jgi:hypothetical protein